MDSKAGTFNRLTLPLIIVGGGFVILAFIFAFTITPMVYALKEIDVFVEIQGLWQQLEHPYLFSQKILYFHVPVGILSMGALVFTAVYGILFLRTCDSKYDLRAKTATEISLVFVLMTMASGLVWTRFEWSVWWSWEPRLTTFFILMLMVIGYFLLRTAVSDPERRAMYSAVFGIIVFINAPICFLITRLIPSGLHPVILRAGSGMSLVMLIPLLMALVGFSCIAFALYQQRLRSRQLEERLDMLKLHIDEIHEKG